MLQPLTALHKKWIFPLRISSFFVQCRSIPVNTDKFLRATILKIICSHTCKHVTRFSLQLTYHWLNITQSTWMHLSCIFETSHTVSQRHPKEDWLENLWDVSREIDYKDVSSETFLRSLRFSQRRLWVASETAILGFQTNGFFGYLIIYLWVIKYFAKLI